MLDKVFCCWLTGALFLGAAVQTAWAEGISRVSFQTSDWIQRADLYVLQADANPVAWLLLCPGRNGNGESFLHDPAWRQFAEEHQLWMAAISFASTRKNDLLGRYTQVADRIGDWILGECDRRAPQKMPLFLVGFSAGARFTANFAAWKPDRILAWSAQAVGHWPEPQPAAIHPPGIVASGEYDSGSWFASLQYFQACKKLNERVTWVSVRKLDHQRSRELDDFTRAFFQSCLPGQRDPDPVWRDIDTKRNLSSSQAAADPLSATWLPNKALGEHWDAIHCQ